MFDWVLNVPPQLAFTCSKLTIEALEQGLFIVNSEHVSLLVNFEHVIVNWA